MSGDLVTNVVGPDDPGGIVYTIKGGAGYDAPWLVVRGNSAAEIAAQVQDVTGLDPGEYETVFEFLVAVDRHIKGVLAATGIGAPVKKEYGKPKSQGFAAGRKEGQAAALTADDDKPKHEFQEYLDELADATSLSDIGKVYAKDKRENEGKAWKNAEVNAAAEAKAKSFS